MILFDSQKRIPVAISGRVLRFQQDTQRFLADSAYYFDLTVSQLEILMAEAGGDDRSPPAYFPDGRIERQGAIPDAAALA